MRASAISSGGCPQILRMLWILAGLAELAFRSWNRSNSPPSCSRRDGAFTSWIGWLVRVRYSGSGAARTSARPRNHSSGASNIVV